MRRALPLLSLPFLSIGAMACNATTIGDGDHRTIATPTCEPTGYTNKPGSDNVEIKGAGLRIDQFYNLDDPGGRDAPEPLMGAQDRQKIVLTIRPEDDTAEGIAFPGDGMDGIHVYLNGCLIPERKGSAGWSATATDEDVPLQLVAGNWMVWEVRAWAGRSSVPAQTDGGIDGGGGAEDDAGPDLADQLDKIVLYRAVVRLPPGDGAGAGFPNFVAPADGEVLADSDFLQLSWTPMGITGFLGTGEPQALRIQAWLEGTPPDITPVGTVNVPDESVGSARFNVGIFSEWDWLAMSATIELLPFPMTVVATRHVND